MELVPCRSDIMRTLTWQIHVTFPLSVQRYRGTVKDLNLIPEDSDEIGFFIFHPIFLRLVVKLPIFKLYLFNSERPNILPKTVSTMH